MPTRFLTEARRARYLFGLLLLGALLVPHARAAAQESGRCVSTEVDSPIVLPDGSRHPAGPIQICVDRVHTPVATFHEARINGSRVGLYPSRTFLNEDLESERPYVVFRRDAHGDLVLQGYAVPEGRRMRTFLMAHPHRIYTR